MKKFLFTWPVLALFIGITSGTAAAADNWRASSHDGVVVPLWENKIPYSKGNQDHDKPFVTVFLPAGAKTPTAAAVICPGGSYGHLAWEKEGINYAKFLNSLGMAGIVLRYRLGTPGQGSYRHPVMLTDVSRAMRLTRFNAKKWNIDPARIGVMGSSAGGHLAATMLTQFDRGDTAAADPVDRESSRPDFGILCYPVISMTPGLTHRGSHDNLLGKDASTELENQMSAELQVKSDTPKCFIWHTSEDGGVPAANSLAFASALAAKKIPFELHIFEKGGHGLGLQDTPPFENVHPWGKELARWLKAEFAR